MSASLIGHLRSSTFRLSTTAVSMSLTGSRFSSESAPRPFHYGIRGRGGTIFGSALPLHQRQVQADIRTHLIHRPARDIFPRLGGTLRKRTRSQGPLLRRHYPASTLPRPCPLPAMTAAFRNVEAATLALDGSPPITRTTFPTCRAHYPGGSSGCACRLLPRSCSLPQMAGGSASALSLSRPAQASLTLRPARLLNRLKRPLSRGSSPAGHPAEPLVSYQINRQLSGWNLPPLVIRAFGAHCQNRTHAPLAGTPSIRSPRRRATTLAGERSAQARSRS